MAKIATRLHIDAELNSGAAVGLDSLRAHFLRDVLRLRSGAEIAVFNARDGEFSARLDGIGKGWASLSVGEPLRAPKAEPDLWLVFAPIKRARLDFLIEKATELGVSRLQPVATSRTQVERINGERFAAIAREAAEQSERLSLPEIGELTKLERLLENWAGERRLIFADEGGDGRPAAQALPSLERGPLALLTGPEGGFSPEERARLAKLPFVTQISLGPRILRADTAALAGLALIQAHLGDWTEARPGG